MTHARTPGTPPAGEPATPRYIAWKGTRQFIVCDSLVAAADAVTTMGGGRIYEPLAASAAERIAAEPDDDLTAADHLIGQLASTPPAPGPKYDEIEAAARLGYETSVLHWVGESEYDEDGEHSWEKQTDGLRETWRAIARNVLALAHTRLAAAESDRDGIREAVEWFIRVVTADPDGEIEWATLKEWLTDFAGQAERWRDDRAELSSALAAATAERDELKADNRLHRQKAEGEYWAWQGDGSDYLETLVCPVLIPAEALLALAESRVVAGRVREAAEACVRRVLKTGEKPTLTELAELSVALSLASPEPGR